MDSGKPGGHHLGVAKSFDTGLLRTFVTVAELKSFTGATSHLSLTQSAISLQIRRLEELVEAALLERSRRGVQLTAAGEVFMVYARQILALQEDALRGVHQLPSGGTLRVGLPDVFAIKYLPSVLEAFTRAHPDVQPQVYCDVSVNVVDRFERGLLDVTLTVRHGEPGGTVVGEDEVVWVSAPHIELSPSAPVPLALYPEYCTYRARGLKALADAGRSWQIVYTTQSSSAIDIAINRGWAVAIKASCTTDPAWRILGEADDMPRLEPVQLEVRRSAADGSSALERFVELLEDEVRRDLGRPEAEGP